jgi:rRNA maturation endonuclease Nob1
MSEHEEIKETLSRIEIKLDLLHRIMGYKVISCDDTDYHKSFQIKHKECPTCGGYGRELYPKKLES